MKLHQEKVAVRKSLPLTERDLRDLELLRQSPARRHALFALVDIESPGTDSSSEAQLLHSVLQAGLRAVAERVEEESYAAEAGQRRVDDAAHRSSARRRRPEWASES